MNISGESFLGIPPRLVMDVSFMEEPKEENCRLKKKRKDAPAER